MNLRAVKRDVAVPAAMPVADVETKPAVVGKGSDQVSNWKDRRYSRTHDCNLSRSARAVQAAPGWSAARGLRRYWFPFDTPGVRAQALVHAPAAFRRRGVDAA